MKQSKQQSKQVTIQRKLQRQEKEKIQQLALKEAKNGS